MRMDLLNKMADYLYREKHYPFYILAISAFILLFQLEGSIGNWDEAIYSEVAKEGLARNDWMSLWYRDGIWFEKPPLVIWLTMISYRIFGISEFSTWLFPVLFGIMGILGVYYMGKMMFGPKVGLLASLVLVTTPHYLVMSRNNMMDIFLFTNLIWSFVFLIKTRKNGKYLIPASVFLALAFMTKNFASVLIYPVMAFWLYANRRECHIGKKHIFASILVFLAIVLPWHLSMYLEYGWEFIENYIGIHIIERFNSNMLDLKQSSDVLYYFKVLLQRSGSWWLTLVAFLPLMFNDARKNVKRKEISTLIIWILIFFISYSASKTKLHHYILPIYAPISLAVAYGLHRSYLRRSIFGLLPLFIIFMNIDPATIRQVSDFGEARLVFPIILYGYFHFTEYIVYVSAMLLIACISIIYFQIGKRFASGASIVAVLMFSILIPFNPDRAPLAKEVGKRLKEENVKIIRHIDLKNLNIDGSLVFYTYPTKVVPYKKKINFEFNAESPAYCLMDRSSAKDLNEIVYDFYPCMMN
jgi:asparagine N-glycosylation enzyme membrane subunit Stt3